MDVVHDLPETGSWQRQHVLDDEASCWCRPVNEVIANRLMITHRKEDDAEDQPARRGPGT